MAGQPDTTAAEIPAGTMHTPDRGSEGFWLGHVRLGLAASIVVLALIGLYLLATPSEPHRPLVWTVLAAAAVLTAVMSVLPWRRLIADGRALPMMVGWSLCLVPMIVLLAAVDGGGRSPFSLLLVVPLVFSTLAYPVRATILVGGAMIAGQVTIVLVTPDTGIQHVLLQGAGMALIASMCTLTSRNHWEALAREESLAAQLRRLADRDGMTGCFNHRGFHERLDAEVARSLRSGQPITLLHADLDHFKRVNDGFGHPAGDEVLARVGQTLQGFARVSDVVGRVGGEEFAVLLPSSTLAEGRAVGERIRAAIGQVDRPVPVTISVGVSSLPESAGSEEQLVASADRALYAAKRAGRDRVAVAPPVHHPHADVAAAGRP